LNSSCRCVRSSCILFSLMYALTMEWSLAARFCTFLKYNSPVFDRCRYQARLGNCSSTSVRSLLMSRPGTQSQPMTSVSLSPMMALVAVLGLAM